MNQGIQFVCPSCDAPLTAEPGQTQVICKYCGSTVIVPEELRTRPAAPTTQRGTPPSFVPPPFVPPPAPPVIIVEQPQMVYTPPPTPQWQPQRRRSRGCGCGCGCWTLVSIVICVALVLGGLSLQNLGSLSLSSVYADIQTRVPQIDSVMASLPATILSFNASATTVSGNTPVMLTWIASGASITLDRFDPKTGALAQHLSVPPIGSQTFFLPASGGRPVIFRLTANARGSVERRDITIR